MQRSKLSDSLPAGEELLWQGRPEWRALARRAFHVRKVAIYFCLLVLWRAAFGMANRDTVATLGASALWMILLGCAAVGLLAVMAWLIGRTTFYTITTRRLVFQFGVALPMTLNIPFRVISSAAFKAYPDGTGEIPVSLIGADRVAYLVLWPHARPWRAARPEPMMRAVPDAERVAEILSHAFITAKGSSVTASASVAATTCIAAPPVQSATAAA
jgi:Bacterial PH domain